MAIAGGLAKRLLHRVAYCVQPLGQCFFGDPSRNVAALIVSLAALEAWLYGGRIYVMELFRRLVTKQDTVCSTFNTYFLIVETTVGTKLVVGGSKATGLVTNTRVTHATPAALYAHSASRYWEDDSKVPPKARKTCKDITRQLIEDEPGRNLNVTGTHFQV
ncbi:hypothetical protein J6590_055677 [Homalodisca vitripennis]|nr:hypothetical protein J6590_055677 [Homalodisca vitripennis]